MRKQDGAGIRRMGSALSRVAVLRAGGLCARGRRPHAPGSQCTRVTIRVARGPAQNAKQLLRPLSLPTGERTRGRALPWEPRSRGSACPHFQPVVFPDASPRGAASSQALGGRGRPGLGVRQAGRPGCGSVTWVSWLLCVAPFTSAVTIGRVSLSFGVLFGRTQQEDGSSPQLCAHRPAAATGR